MGRLPAKVYEKLRFWVRDNYCLRKRAYELLASPWLASNWLYQQIAHKRIESVVSQNEEFPPAVSLESSSICNADCSICAYSKMSRKKGIMHFSLFKRIVDECARCQTQRIWLSGFGEPLIDPELEGKVEYAKQRGIPMVGIFTNASLLSKSRAQGLLEAGLDELNVSMDGFTANTFSRIQRGIDFLKVSANVRDFMQLRTAKKPLVSIYVVLLDENRDDVANGRRAWEKIVDKVIVRQPQDWVGAVEGISTPSTPHARRRGIQRPPCHYLWTQLNVYWNGDVPLCCLDFDAEVKLGNLQVQTISDIWKGEPLAHYRLMHMARKQAALALCQRCSYFPVWW